jgi:hypothetical protein
MSFLQQLTEGLLARSKHPKRAAGSDRAWQHASIRPGYVRQRADDGPLSVVQCSVMDQRRITCISAAFLEPFWSSLSLSTLCAGCELLGTDDGAGDGHRRHGADRQRRERSRGALRAGR